MTHSLLLKNTNVSAICGNSSLLTSLSQEQWQSLKCRAAKHLMKKAKKDGWIHRLETRKGRPLASLSRPACMSTCQLHYLLLSMTKKVKQQRRFQGLPSQILQSIYFKGILPSITYGISVWGNNLL